uniref:Serpentine Receptor, class H n=1 Tax=Caenorhabditis tropicalis TaxID=1561998 RepID=A0A1I7TY05_9PELO
MCLFTGNSKWEFWRRPWLIGHYITAVVASISFGLFQPEQSEARIRVLEKLPPLPAYIKESSIYVFTENGTYHLTVFLILIPFICIEVFIFVKELILTTSTLLASKKMSDRTYHLQRKFFIALVIQCGVPIITLIIPFIYSWISILWKYYNQGLMNIAVITTALHGISSTLVMLIVHEPYRKAVKSFFIPEEGFRKWYGMQRNTVILSVYLVFFGF